MKNEKNVVPPTYEVSNADQLNKFLLGLLRDTRSGACEVSVAEAASKIADKIIKHNLTRIMYMRARNTNQEIQFFEGAENMLTISKNDL